MTEKERLEEIKEKYFMYENYTGKVIMYHHVLEWLIEQAERVQELEEENTQLSNEMEGLFQKLEDREPYYSMKCLKLEGQNKRYREVINNINEKAMLYGVDEQVFEAIKEAIRVLEGEE